MPDLLGTECAISLSVMSDLCGFASVLEHAIPARPVSAVPEASQRVIQEPHGRQPVREPNRTPGNSQP